MASISEDIIEQASGSDSDSQLTEAEQQELQKEITDVAKRIKVVCGGCTGVRKSTLLNGLMGVDEFEDASFDVGHSLHHGTENVIVKRFRKNGVEITLCDIPGLEQYDVDAAYLDEVKEICGNFDIFLYCVTLRSTIDLRNSELFNDKSSLVKYTKLFGADLWEKAVIILTEANILEAYYKGERFINNNFNVKEAFCAKICEWEQKIHEELISKRLKKGIVRKIPVLPAGLAQCVNLPGHRFWLSKIFEKVLDRMKFQAKLVYIQFSQDRFKHDRDEISITEIKIGEQPFFVSPKLAAAGASAIVGGTTLRALLPIGVPSFGVLASVFTDVAHVVRENMSLELPTWGGSEEAFYPSPPRALLPIDVPSFGVFAGGGAGGMAGGMASDAAGYAAGGTWGGREEAPRPPPRFIQERMPPDSPKLKLLIVGLLLGAVAVVATAAYCYKKKRQATISTEEEGQAERAHNVLERQWVVDSREVLVTGEELGRGGWGVVKVAEFRGIKVAAKSFFQAISSRYYRQLFIREMKMAARIWHPNLVRFIGACMEGELIMLTELLPTSLRKELEKDHHMSPDQLLSVSLDVAWALNYLHRMQPDPIIHRDISSANVLLEPLDEGRWRAKVSDYGSVQFQQQLKTENPGSPVYSAPEAIYPHQQSPKMDIFSFGVLLVEMCTAQFPEVESREMLIASIRDREWVGLIRQCTQPNQKNRPSAANIITELQKRYQD